MFVFVGRFLYFGEEPMSLKGKEYLTVLSLGGDI